MSKGFDFSKIAISGAKTSFQQVKEFHEVFGAFIADKPSIPDENLLRLRWNLIKEEYVEIEKELFTGTWNQTTNLPDLKEDINLPNLVKELCDLIYVLEGFGLALGVDMDKCFAEVHRSNMSKLDENGEVVRREDGKILKSNLYSPANIGKVISG